MIFKIKFLNNCVLSNSLLYNFFLLCTKYRKGLENWYPTPKYKNCFTPAQVIWLHMESAEYMARFVKTLCLENVFERGMVLQNKRISHLLGWSRNMKFNLGYIPKVLCITQFHIFLNLWDIPLVWRIFLKPIEYIII